MNEGILRAQAEEIAALMPQLARGLLAVDRDAAAELPLAQLRVCGVLAGGPRPMSAIGRELGVTLSAMTQIADRLERAELVHRVAEGTDRRIRRLQLTPRGEKMMVDRKKAQGQRVLRVISSLTSKERKDVLTGLKTLLRACIAGAGTADSPKFHPSHPITPSSTTPTSASKASL